MNDKKLVSIIYAVSFFTLVNFATSPIAYALSIKRDASVKITPPTKEMISEREKIYFELSGEKVEKLNEIQIYNKITEKYRSGDLRATEAFTHLLISKYSQSIFADNSLYMCGLLAIDQKFFGKALQSFNDILDRFPTSNKAVSALFAKGMLLKKMNLVASAKKALIEVKKRYPGSPESYRSELELKILNK